MTACRQLGFDVTGNSAIRSAHPENPRTIHEVYRIMRCADTAIHVSWGHMEPPILGKRGRRGSAMAPFERAMVVSYRLSIVTVALSVTIRPQFAMKCLTIKSTGGGSILAKISGCSRWSRPLMFGSAKSEHPLLSNGETISEEFQPV